MDETIDLRPYAEGLLRYWWVMLGTTVLALLLAAAFLNLNEWGYRASALVAITDPTEQLKFDPRIENRVGPTQLVDAFPEIALSDELLRTLLEQPIGSSGSGIGSVSKLRSMLDVNANVEPRLLKFSATSADPAMSAELANKWAEEFVSRVNRVYIGTEDAVDYYRAQLVESRAQLEEADQAMVAFQADNRLGIIENELLALNTLHLQYQTDHQRLESLLDDIVAFRTHLEAIPESSFTVADQLTAMGLQLEAYGAINEISAPQIVLSPETQLTASSRTAQLELLDTLTDSLTPRIAKLENDIASLEPQFLALQQEQQALTNRDEQLTRERTIEQETFVTLARKVDEEQVAAGTQTALLVSRASLPDAPAQPSSLLSFGGAAVLGILAGIAIVVVLIWWKAGRHTASDSSTA